MRWDIRKAEPYAAYADLDFEIPIGERGDVYDRYLVRMEEMVQSMRIIEQAIQKMPEGNIMVGSKGQVIPAAMMVDEAKMGHTQDFKGRVVEADPTLDGSGGPAHGSVYSSDKRVALPAKEDAYGNIEGLMNHFKLVMYGHGLRPPKGE